MFFHCFSEKKRLDVSSESSARQKLHMKNQALFSSKDKSKKLKCRLLQFLFDAFKVKVIDRFPLNIDVPSFFQIISHHCLHCIMTKLEDFLCAR